MTTRLTLGNGEVWELRYDSWHMVGVVPTRENPDPYFDGEYSPLSTREMLGYASLFDASWHRHYGTGGKNL